MKERQLCLSLMIATLCVVTVLSACNQPQRLTTTSAPANQLRLELAFLHALSPSTQVIIDVNVLTDEGGRWSPVTLTNRQSLTINGQHVDTDSPAQSTEQFTVKRPPAGGEYRIAYADGQGKQTTVVVQAPQQALTITAPAANTRLAIPQPGASLTIQYTAPFPLTSPFAHHPFAQINGNAAGNCKAAAPTPVGTPPAAPPPTPTDAVPSQPSFCISIYGHASDMTGTALVSDTTLVQAAGFGNLAPGPGEVAIYMEVFGDMPTTAGFAGVRIHFLDSTFIPVTWV